MTRSSSRAGPPGFPCFSWTAPERGWPMPATWRGCPPPRRRRGYATTWAGDGGSPRSVPRASVAFGTRRSPTTGGMPGAAGLARCSARRTSRRSRCTRRGRCRRPTRKRCSGWRGTCGPGRSGRRRRSIVSSARWPTSWRSTRSRRCRRVISRRRRSRARLASATSPIPRRGLIPRRGRRSRGCGRLPAAGARPARSAASTSTGWGARAAGAGAGAGARPPAWSTRTSSRSARCAASAILTRCSRRARCATSSASTPSRPAARSPGRWSARNAA